MSGVRYTLLTDGTSDRGLAHAIDWALHRRGWRVESRAWADLSLLSERPASITTRIRDARRLYPCDLLFVHRDAESEPRLTRAAEIRSGLEVLDQVGVPVVPVRMTEAWWLHDERAIRQASGNPNGTAALNLPSPSRIEHIQNPKAVLFEALITATETSGRRRAKRTRQLPRMRARLAELIDDYTPILRLSAFEAFLGELDRALSLLRDQEPG